MIFLDFIFEDRDAEGRVGQKGHLQGSMNGEAEGSHPSRLGR